MKGGILFQSPLDANMHLTDYFVKEFFLIQLRLIDIRKTYTKIHNEHQPRT